MGEALNLNNGGDKSNLLNNGGILKKPLEKKVIPAPAWDGRSELLKAIRDGIFKKKYIILIYFLLFLTIYIS